MKRGGKTDFTLVDMGALDQAERKPRFLLATRSVILNEELTAISSPQKRASRSVVLLLGVINSRLFCVGLRWFYGHCFSLDLQRHHWFNPCRSPRGHPAGNQHNHHQD